MTFRLSDLLQKYSKLTVPGRVIRETTQKIIIQMCAVDIPLDEITFNKKTVFLQVHPLVKKTVLEREKEVLQEIEKEMGKKIVEAIR